MRVTKECSLERLSIRRSHSRLNEEGLALTDESTIEVQVLPPALRPALSRRASLSRAASRKSLLCTPSETEPPPPPPPRLDLDDRRASTLAAVVDAEAARSLATYLQPLTTNQVPSLSHQPSLAHVPPSLAHVPSLVHAASRPSLSHASSFCDAVVPALSATTSMPPVAEVSAEASADSSSTCFAWLRPAHHTSGGVSFPTYHPSAVVEHPRSYERAAEPSLHSASDPALAEATLAACVRPSGAKLPLGVSYFAFPPILGRDAPTVTTFSLTDEHGVRRYGVAVAFLAPSAGCASAACASDASYASDASDATSTAADPSSAATSSSDAVMPPSTPPPRPPALPPTPPTPPSVAPPLQKAEQESEAEAKAELATSTRDRAPRAAASAADVTPLALLALCAAPIVSVLERFLCEQASRAAAAAEAAAEADAAAAPSGVMRLPPADAAIAAFAAATAAMSAALSQPPCASILPALGAHPCWTAAPLAASLAAFSWREGPLMTAFIAILADRPLLLHGEQALLLPAVELLVSLLHPLAPCGLLIPLLPEGLHPEPETLINDAPDPYVLGITTAFYSTLHVARPEAGGPVVVSVADGTVCEQR